MSESTESRCPCCQGSTEDFPGQEGACEHYCRHCGWREHVPGSDSIAAALTLRKGREPDSEPASRLQPQTAADVDPELLERQAAILGKIVDGGHPTEEERSCLEGLWEFVHTILDSLQTHGQCADQPTIVVFVHGGMVQGVEGKTPVRVAVCDFDCIEEAQTVGGRPCHIGVWDSPEEPSEESAEVLRLAAGPEDPSFPRSAHSQSTEKEGGDADMS